MRDRRRLLVTVLSGGIPWTDVTAPDAAFSFVPFTIQQRAREFRPATTFDLATYSGITPTVTYYVDINAGLDTNTGLSWAQALKTVGAAAVKADVDRIYIAKGYYHRSTSNAGGGYSRNVQVIGDLTQGVGDAVYITSDCINQINAFGAVGDHYSATTARTIRSVRDSSVLDAHGHATLLALVADEATVDTTPGSWFQGGGSVYIRTSDSRTPDASLRYYESGSPCLMLADNRTLYVENIQYQGGWNTCSIKNASAAGGALFYAKNCSFAYGCRPGSAYDVIDVQGATSIFWGCTAYGSPDGDAFNYKVLNTVLPVAIEIDCEGYNCGDTTIDQGSTMHDNGSIVRLMGEYHHVKGQCIADDGTGKAWNLGTYMHDSEATGVGKDGYSATGGFTAWLDSCRISVVRYDLLANASTIYYRNLTSGGSFSGTTTPY